MKDTSKNLLSILVIPFKLPTAVKFEYSGEYKIDDPSVALIRAEHDYLEKKFGATRFT